jgi:hypothetical protein
LKSELILAATSGPIKGMALSEAERPPMSSPRVETRTPTMSITVGSGSTRPLTSAMASFNARMMSFVIGVMAAAEALAFTALASGAKKSV